MTDIKQFTKEEVSRLPQLDYQTYAQTVYPIVLEIQTKFQIPLIVPTIQSAHESRNGNSGLSRLHCNLFGIVATDSWKVKGGAIAAMKTWEEIKGKRVDMTREFRAYGSWEDSFYDWAKLISGYSGYKKAYEFFKVGDVVEGIKEMGKIYASDSAYSRKLLEIYREVNV